jgi:hypothetical protein
MVRSSNTATPTEFTFNQLPVRRGTDVPGVRALHDQALDAHRLWQYVEPLLGFLEVVGYR